MHAPAPSVLVHLPRGLLSLFPEARATLELRAETVNAMLDQLDRHWPGMRACICDSRPAIRRHINIFVDGERVGLETRLDAGDEVEILTAISGG